MVIYLVQLFSNCEHMMKIYIEQTDKKRRSNLVKYFVEYILRSVVSRSNVMGVAVGSSTALKLPFGTAVGICSMSASFSCPMPVIYITHGKFSILFEIYIHTIKFYDFFKKCEI